MSVTFSSGKKVAAIVAPNGGIFYLLLEEHYESNVWPRTPHWSATHFGDAKTCMDHIIMCSGSCEGGSLQEPGGFVSPSAYIKHWRAAMAKPVLLAEGLYSAKFGQGIYSLNPDNRSKIEALLERYGHPGIDGDMLDIKLPEQAELLAAITQSGGSPAWKFLDHHDIRSVQQEWAAYDPPATKGTHPDFQSYYLREAENREAEHWIVEGDLIFRAGWAYSAIDMLIHRYVRPAEKENPGCAEAVIKSIRANLKKAVPFPADQQVEISLEREVEKFYLDSGRRALKKLGAEGKDRVVTTIGSIIEAGAAYEFKCLKDEMVKFINLPKTVTHQQDLLLAA